MTKISVKGDCGNSPKKLFLKRLNIAFLEADIAFILQNVSDDIIWNNIGGRYIQGKGDFAKSLEELKTVRVSELILSTIITHGKNGAVNGEVILPNGKRHAFCDIYEFTGANGSKIKSITSYVIPIPE